MAASLTEAEAELLLKCKEGPVRENYAEFLAVKIGRNSSYISSCIRQMELGGLLKTSKIGKRKLVTSLNPAAVKQAEQQQQQQQQQQKSKM